MFRGIVFASAFLIGCESKTRSDPLFIKLPEPGYICCENGGAQRTFSQEAWTKRALDLEVFNQKHQRLILEIYDAPTLEEKPIYYIKDGNKFYSSLNSPVFKKEEETFLLSIHKQGLESSQEFIRRFVNWTRPMEKNCELIEVHPGAWQIRPVPGRGFQYFQGQSASEICTQHSKDNHKPGSVFLIKDGVVVLYFHRAYWGGVDLNSIVYENRG